MSPKLLPKSSKSPKSKKVLVSSVFVVFQSVYGIIVLSDLRLIAPHLKSHKAASFKIWSHAGSGAGRKVRAA